MIIASLDDPQLQVVEMQARASRYYHRLLDGSAWEKFQANINPALFRGEHNYLSQLILGATPEKYRNTLDYVVSIDTEHYLTTLGEDDQFGCITFPMGADMCYSRDLLDSILEIYFLRDVLKLTNHSNVNLLDIGAGYGRFAHRFCTAFPYSTVTCVDAVPMSTYLCRRYLWHRNVHRSLVQPLSYVEDWLDHPHRNGHIVNQVAVNIHSWSECTLSAINLWLDVLVAQGVKYLFIVPHDERCICIQPDGTFPSFLPAIEQHGYKLKISRSKFPPGVDGIYPDVIYTLWELQ